MQQIALVDEPLFGLLAFDKLSDLAANVRHHGQDLLIGWAYLATEKLNHPENSSVESNWEAQGSMQAGCGRDRSAREIMIFADILNPHRLAFLPGSAW